MNIALLLVYTAVQADQISNAQYQWSGNRFRDCQDESPCWDGSARDPHSCLCPPEPASQKIRQSALRCGELACPEFFVPNMDTCECVPDGECAQDFVCWNDKLPITTNCICDEEPVCDECPSYMVPGLEFCSCVCSKDLCDDGFSPNPDDMCRCEAVMCTQDLCWDGSARNPNDCSCPPLPETIQYECKEGFHLMPEMDCMCVSDSTACTN